VPVVYDRETRAKGEMGPEGQSVKDTYAEFARRLARERDVCARTLGARGAVAIDPRSLIDAVAKADGGRTTWFVDDCHYTDEGNDVLARLYVEKLAAEGLLGGAK
jgi:hypothetical protein